MTTSFELVPVGEDTIECVRGTSELNTFISVKRVCERLGIAHQPQIEKLKAKSWATVTTIVMEDSRGRKREVFCIALQSLPKWLGEIDENRVAVAARPTLIRFQKEAHDVLCRHFFGIDKNEDPMQQLIKIERMLAENSVGHSHWLRNHEERIGKTEDKVEQHDKILGVLMTPAQKRKLVLKELHVTYALWQELGGSLGVRTPQGDIDLLTDEWVIEVKVAKDYLHACGQVEAYAKYYPSKRKRIHLFGKCPPSKRKLVETHCLNQGIVVTFEAREINELLDRFGKLAMFPRNN